MPPRRMHPMMGRNYGMNNSLQFMMARPQRGANLFGAPSRSNGPRGLGMNMGRSRGRSGGLLSKITGTANGNRAGGGGGGLLSRLLGGGSRASNSVTGFEGVARGGGSVASSLSQSGGITNFLNQTQSVLKAASQIQPMIEQYGPLVRNLPAMWKLYRELKNVDTDDSDQGEKNQEKEQKEKTNESNKTKQKKNNQKKKNEKKGNSTQSHVKGSSLPKLYV